MVSEVILRASQSADSVSAHESVPPVWFKRLIVWASGFVPPADPDKLRVVGFKSMLAVVVVGVFVPPPVETANVTGIVVI